MRERALRWLRRAAEGYVAILIIAYFPGQYFDVGKPENRLDTQISFSTEILYPSAANGNNSIILVLDLRDHTVNDSKGIQTI